jgi:16S rRNA (uracil1498-N3)-methyltransferase
MQHHRFFAPNIAGAQITLDRDEAHHLTRVLRLGAGATVFAFDGCGNEYECTVANTGKQSVTLDIRHALVEATDSPLQLTLAQALVKGDKFDWIVQKASELGVTRIVPLITEHSDIRQSEERAEHKLGRWRRIALEAVKQCGRRRLVEIAEPQTFAALCVATNSEMRWMLAERDGTALPLARQAVTSATVAVGPEGGWSDAEFALAHQHQFTLLQLGRRVLRTETAAIVAVTLAQTLAGDLG